MGRKPGTRQAKCPVCKQFIKPGRESEHVCPPRYRQQDATAPPAKPGGGGIFGVVRGLVKKLWDLR